MAATKTAPVSTDQALAATARVLRAAIGNLASQFGYSRGTLNEILLALGADPEDLESMRQFLVGNPPAGGEPV
jgi:hypothetical protein